MAASGQAGDPALGFSFGKTHVLTGSPDGVLYDYPIHLTVSRGAGTDQGEHVYLGGRAANWPDDIRFAGENGGLLSYWVESADDQSASIWVKVPVIPRKPGEVTIRLYFGNAAAGTASSGPSTWAFFDDFPVLDESRWEVIYGNPKVADSALECVSKGPRVELYSREEIAGVDTRVLARVKTAHFGETGTTEVFSAAGHGLKGLHAYFSERSEPAKSHTYVNWIHGDPLGYYPIKGWTPDTWHVLSATRLNRTVVWTVDRQYPVYCNATYWTEPGKVGMTAIYDGAEVDVDWVCVGPATANEPEHGKWAPESGLTGQGSPTPPESESALKVEGFSYSKTHEILGSTDGQLSDYPVRFVVHRGSGIDGGEDFYLNGGSLNWPDDVRFTDGAGKPCPFWVESSDSDSAVVWVKVGQILASPGTTRLTVSYGKRSAESASDIEGTFVFSDDFTTFDNVTKWDNNGFVHLEQGTVLRVSTSLDDGYYTSNAISTRRDNFTPGQAVIVRLKGNDYLAHYNLDFGYKNDDNRVEIQGDYNTPETHGKAYVNGSNTITGNICNNKETYHTYEIKRYPAGDRVDYLVDDQAAATLTKDIYGGNGTIRIGPWVRGSEVFVDWIAVRPFTADEPAHGDWIAGMSPPLGPGDAPPSIPTIKATPTPPPVRPTTTPANCCGNGYLILGLVALIVVIGATALGLLIVLVVLDELKHKKPGR